MTKVSYRYFISLSFILLLISSTVIAEEFATLTGNVKSFDHQPLVIYLEPVSKTKTTAIQEKKQISIISNDNNFKPAFQVVQKGSILKIKNNDSILHNTHISQNNITLFNVATPLTNTVVNKIIPRTGFFNVACDLHPWMKASIAVISSSYYSVLQKPGEFKIDNIIPGEYKLHSLQAAKDEVVSLISLKANSEKHISF